MFFNVVYLGMGGRIPSFVLEAGCQEQDKEVLSFEDFLPGYWS
jgi:hypothetical protein